MSEFRDLLLAELERPGFSPGLSEEQIGGLENHYRLLTTWNRKINLTSIRTLSDSVRRHYCECLYFAALLKEKAVEQGCRASSTVLDAGSGGGFPGIPIAILIPEWRVILVESGQRKAAFLREAGRNLPNVSVVCERLSQVQNGGDWIVSRAVRPVDVIAESPRLGRWLGLLLGSEGAADARRDPRITWQPNIPLFWGEETVALFGAYSH